MDIRFQTGGPSAWKAEAVLTFVFEGEGPDEACHVLEQAAPWLGIAPAWRDFKGKSVNWRPCMASGHGHSPCAGRRAGAA